MITAIDPIETQLKPTNGRRRARGRTCFSWSIGKIRVAALVLVVAALPAAIGFAASPSGEMAVAAGCSALCPAPSGRRATTTEAVVLTIDQYGILTVG